MISKALLRKDSKIILRDPMIILLLFVPFLMSGLVQFVIRFDPFRFLPFHINREPILLVLRSILPFFGGIMAGSITGFIILEEKESGVIPQLKVSPLSQKSLLTTRLLLTLLLGLFVTFLLSLSDRIFFGAIRGGLAIFLLCSFMGPFIMMIMAGFGKSRVQGLTLAKLSTLLMVPPILDMFLNGIPRWIFIFLSPLTCFFAALSGIYTGELSLIKAIIFSGLGVILLIFYTALLMHKVRD